MDKKLLDDIWLYGCNKYIPDRVTYNKQQGHLKNRKAEGGLVKRKQLLIEAARTECQHCGAPDIEWHHVDKSTKLFNISSNTASIDEFILELDKCICLCRSCHMAAHREEKVEQTKLQWDVSRPNR